MMLLPLLAALNGAPASPANARASNPATPPTKPNTTMTFLIGSYTKDPAAGISRATFNALTGEISAPSVAAATPNPTWLTLSPDGKTLFAANEGGKVAGVIGGGLSAFAIGDDHGLTFLADASLPGGPCHVALDTTGRYAVGATYGAGTVGVFDAQRAGEGKLVPIRIVQHAGTKPDGTPKKPHAHQVVFSPDNRFFLAADLGLDQVLSYSVEDDGKSVAANEAGTLELPPGSGPRHLAFHPNSKYLYVAGELGNTVTTFQYEAETGKGAQLQHLSTLPDDFDGKSHVAEIAIHPNGKFLYVSNRGNDSIARFEIDGDGTLKPLGHTRIGAKTPRHFTLDPTGKWMLVANANAQSITSFKLDENTGDLEKVATREGFDGQPVCLLFLP